MSTDTGCVNQLCDPLVVPDGWFDVTLTWLRSVTNTLPIDTPTQMILGTTNLATTYQTDFIVPSRAKLIRVWGYVSSNGTGNAPFPAPTEIDVYSLVNGVEVGKVSFDSSINPVVQKSSFPNLDLTMGDILTARIMLKNAPVASTGAANYGMCLRMYP